MNPAVEEILIPKVSPREKPTNVGQKIQIMSPAEFTLFIHPAWLSVIIIPIPSNFGVAKEPWTIKQHVDSLKFTSW